MSTQLRNTGWKVAIATFIGIGVVAWMFAREFKPETLDGFIFDSRSILCLVLAAIAMCGRDFGLTNGKQLMQPACHSLRLP